MRIRFYTRNQAICLALSLFLGVFALGLALGFALSGGQPQAQDAVGAFAPIEETPLLTPSTVTPPPSLTPLPSQISMEINLFAFDTPAPTASATPQGTPMPSYTPAPTVPPTPQPGELRIEVIRGPGISSTAGSKRILIYHTHTYEAYKPTPENTYVPTEEWRTKDNRCNVVRVGEELARLLTAAGYVVVHDTTAYEPPVLSSSYTRSLKMLEESLGRGEKYDLYIDLHRDSYSPSMANHNTVQVGDQKIARLFMLIGKGTGQTGVGYEVKPDWEKNLAIAQSITDSLNEQVPELCRPVRMKTGRFNQHIAPTCILIEAGNNGNTLEEALAGMPYLADAIRSVLNASAPEE